MQFKLNSYDSNTRKPIANLLKNFSPSKFLDYKACPKAFYFKHIAKIKLPSKKIHLLFGEAIHSAIEDLLNGKNKKIAMSSYGNKFDINFLSEEEKPDHAKMKETGIKIVDLFLSELPKLCASHNINTGKSEEWIKTILKDPFSEETFPLETIGKIDRWTADDRIIDFKTSGSKWNENDIKLKWQTMFYGWMFYQLKGRHPKSITYIVLTKQKTPQIQILEENHRLEDYSRLFHECKNIINKIELGIFDKPEEFHPPYCDCGKYKELLDLKIN